MSFFSNFQTDKCPGPINGNPMNGLAEKVCVQAQRVFDACIKQGQNEGLVLTLSDFTPANPTYPLTFISARSSSSQGTVTNLQVDRLPDKANCARVQAVVNIPMEVIYTDAAGVEGKAQAAIAVAPEGTFNSADGTFIIDCCITVILKVIINVDLLLPSYGYCVIPPAQEYTQEVCAGFFELPLYPQGTVSNNCGCCNK